MGTEQERGLDPSALRAEVVGSLLRPDWLLEARGAHQRGELDGEGLRRVEDRAVDQALAMQAQAGVDVVTDGEMRRLSFQSQLPAAVSGFASWDLEAFLWGRWRGDNGLGDEERERPNLAVVDRLQRHRSLCGHETAYALERADRPLKVTLPSPTLFAAFYDPARAPTCYPDLAAFLDDVTAILAEEVRELEALGVRYLQIDAPHYTMFLDPDYRAFYAERGIPPEDWIDFAVARDNAVMAAGREALFAFHLCRGNQGSRWLTEGGYDPLAADLFPALAADRLMLEYDDERSGDFAPLAHVPEDKTVALGLISTKRGELEDPEGLAHQVEEAARYVPKGRLAVSPQCGFATSVIGNTLSQDAQAAKLALVAGMARRCFG